MQEKKFKKSKVKNIKFYQRKNTEQQKRKKKFTRKWFHKYTKEKFT